MATPVTPFFASVLVAIGGGSGAVLRYQLGRLVTHLAPGAAIAFPWATLAANAIGSAAMGLLVAWLAHHDTTTGTGGEMWRLLLGVGLLGGFTTFSSFSMEMVLLWQRGEAGLAIAYCAASLALGLIGLVGGLFAAKEFI